MKLNRILGIYNETYHKIICIFGLKIKFKRNNIEATEQNLMNKLNIIHRELNRNIQKNLSIYSQHQKTFMPFKNVNAGKEVVLVGTGPTLNYFTGIERNKNTLFVGLNAAFTKPNIRLDYLFMQDYEACIDYIESVPNYIDSDCKLFYGYTCEHIKEKNKVIPESITIRHNANRYYTDWADISMFKPQFVYDVASEPLCCWGTVAFPAMQFILWTNPKKIYLVGCDCSSSHFDNTPLKDNLDDLSHLIKKWKIFKNFANRYYPETEIISVNPVGLRGIFKDVYTESYLTEHPEIKEELGDNVEILTNKLS